MKKLIPIPLLAALVVGCGGTSSPPYKTLSHPALPSGVSQPTCKSGDNHSMGQCLPKRSGSVSPTVVRLPSGVTCADFSNNNPVFGATRWRAMYLHGTRCAEFKVSEGIGFVDSTAQTMATEAKAAGIKVGGYGFQHVCLDNATADANLFVSHLKADGLTGSNTLPPTGDVEFGNGGCNGHNWESTWDAVVRRDTGRSNETYTGAWWWNPNMGTFDPGGYKWVSGYGVNWPFMPVGWHLDEWQYTDRGFNGTSVSDMSLFLGDAAAFKRFSNAPAVNTRLICFGAHPRHNSTCTKVIAQDAGYKKAVASSLRAKAIVVHTLSINNCRQPYRRTVCVTAGKAEKTFSHRVTYFGAKSAALEKQYS